MKRIFIVLLLLCSTFSFSQVIYWEKILNQSYIWDLKRSSNGFLFACRQSYSGILRSTNQGETWNEIPIPRKIYKIAIDHNDFIYVGVDGAWSGVYKSTDYGNSWTVSYYGYIKARSMHISREGIIYVGDYYGKFIKSTDSGTTWSSDSVTNRKITSITSISNGQIFICTEYGPILTSIDYGVSWTELTAAGMFSASTIVADSNDNLYTDRQESGVGISTDLGLTWNLYGNFPNATSSSVVALDTAQNIYYAYGRVYKSTDHGSNWKNMGGPYWVQSIVTFNDKVLLATYDGIFRYDPSTPIYVGNNYFPLKKGVQLQYLRSSVAIDIYNYSILNYEIKKDTIINNKGYVLYKNNWARYSEEDKKIWIWYNDSDRVYMDFKLFATATFQHFTGSQYIAATVFDGSKNLFNRIVKYKGISYGNYLDGYYQESFGENIGPFLNSYSSYAGPDFDSDESLIMAILFDSLGGPIFLTNHYKPEINLIPMQSISSSSFQLFFSVNHFYSKFFDPNSPHNGINFIEKVYFISNYSKNDSVFVNDTVYAYNVPKTNQYLVSLSVDTTLMKNGYFFNYKVIAKDKGLISEVSYSPDSGYYHCVWDFGTSIDDDIKNINNFSLYQNFPNPLNPTTKIKYQIPAKCLVKLKIYDILGKEAAILVDEVKHAGVYEVEFRTDDLYLSSGIYFYRIQAGDFVETKKMILLR